MVQTKQRWFKPDQHYGGDTYSEGNQALVTVNWRMLSYSKIKSACTFLIMAHMLEGRKTKVLISNKRSISWDVYLALIHNRLSMQQITLNNLVRRLFLKNKDVSNPFT